MHFMLGGAKGVAKKEGFLLGGLEGLVEILVPRMVGEQKHVEQEEIEESRKKTDEFTQEQIKEKILLQEKQVELINRIEAELTILAAQKSQEIGNSIDILKIMEEVSSKVMTFNYEEIIKFNNGLEQLKTTNNFGEYKVMPAMAPALPIAVLLMRYGIPGLITYFGGKAAVETYEALQKDYSSNDPNNNRQLVVITPEQVLQQSLLTLFNEKKKSSIADKNRKENINKGIPPSALGPSGKPKIHESEHSTRKRAIDKGIDRGQRGKPPTIHVNPTIGKDHVHPSGSNDREHHSFPKKGAKFHPSKPRNNSLKPMDNL